MKCRTLFDSDKEWTEYLRQYGRDSSRWGLILASLYLLLVVLSACGSIDSEKDKCFGSGGAHFVYDSSGQGQCVYDAPSVGTKK